MRVFIGGVITGIPVGILLMTAGYWFGGTQVGTRLYRNLKKRF